MRSEGVENIEGDKSREHRGGWGREGQRREQRGQRRDREVEKRREETER